MRSGNAYQRGMDGFADILAGSLRRFLEVITPRVDEHEDERNQEEA